MTGIRQNNWIRHADFMLMDLIWLHVSFCIGYFIRFVSFSFPYGNEDYWTLIMVMSLIQILVSIASNNLTNVLRRGYLDELFHTFSLGFLTLVFVALYMYLAHNGIDYSRLQLMYSFLIYFALDYLGRVAYKAFLKKRLESGKKIRRKRTILVYTDANYEDTSSLIKDLQNDFFEEFDIKKILFVGVNNDFAGKLGIPYSYDSEQVLEEICHNWVDEIVVYIFNQTEETVQFVDHLLEMGLMVHSVINQRQVEKNKQLIESVAGQTVITTALGYISPSQAFLKRFFDILGGLVGSLLTIVLSVFIVPAIFISSPGPILFKQERIGKNGKHFRLYKFRTMVPNAEALKDSLREQNRNKDGMMFKLDFDPRIIGNTIKNGKQKTGLGQFLRRTSLDEFPQFFNVLKGDMSLVGTRPPTLDEWGKYEFRHRARLAMKPGMTGLWQVSGRSQITDFEEIVKIATDYIANFKIGLDIKIIFKTVIQFFKHNGAI